MENKNLEITWVIHSQDVPWSYLSQVPNKRKPTKSTRLYVHIGLVSCFLSAEEVGKKTKTSKKTSKNNVKAL